MDEFNPYAAPKGEVSLNPVHLEEQGIWRDGALLVMTKGAVMPGRCLKCNEPTGSLVLRRNLSWHPGAYYLLILIHLVLYIIVALIVRKTAKAVVPICDQHLRQRRWAIAVGWIVALSGIGLVISGVAMGNESFAVPLLLFGTLTFLFGLLYGVIRAQYAIPSKIDNRFVWLKKVCPEYLMELPPFA